MAELSPRQRERRAERSLPAAVRRGSRVQGRPLRTLARRRRVQVGVMRLLLLSLVDRFWWRTPRMRSRRMAGFARVERSSATDLRLAARCCSDSARAALYLRHAADETRH